MRDSDPERVKRDVGRRVAELRRKQGLTQAEIAEVVDVTVAYFARIEGGRENLTIESLAKLAGALSVRVSELFRAPRSRTVKRGRPKSRRADA